MTNTTNSVNDEHTLRELNERIATAEKDRDAAFLWGVMDEKLQFRRASGTVVDKKEYLLGIISPHNRYERVEVVPESMQVMIYESSAVVTLLVSAKGMRNIGLDNPIKFDGVYRNIRVWQKQGEDWKCVMWANTEVEKL